MTGPLRIAVVGCGTAGAAVALLLARSSAGHEVTVFERVPAPGPVGAGIMMQPSGLLVLERLGLADRIIARGAHVARLLCETAAGRGVLDLQYEVLAPGLFGVGLHRGVLFETLFDALTASPARLVCGVSIERIGPAARDRVRLVDGDGAHRGEFDLVVVCDGARSRVRDSMTHLAKTVRPYPWGALWFIGEDPGGRYAGQLHQIVGGTRRMVGLLPTGFGPNGNDASLVSLFVSTRCDRVEGVHARGLAAWKEEVLAVAPLAAPVLDQIDDLGQLTFASYYDVVLPRWHAHRVALLGDAAHATSPQLGQGCNLALCDAAALADAIDAEPTVERALARYTASRRAHLGFYQLATRWLTPFFQSDFALLGALRDALLGPASGIAFVEREMVRSMAGTKTGILSGSRETRMPRVAAPSLAAPYSATLAR
jgi:2-polyprenyl-6-methoxyphenol hydroxylase-like FAD-dependent oxidoreductase